MPLNIICCDTSFAIKYLHFFDDIQARNGGPKDHVLAVQPVRPGRGEEKLGAIGVGARIGHGEDAWPCGIKIPST